MKLILCLLLLAGFSLITYATIGWEGTTNAIASDFSQFKADVQRAQAGRDVLNHVPNYDGKSEMNFDDLLEELIHLHSNRFPLYLGMMIVALSATGLVLAFRKNS